MTFSVTNKYYVEMEVSYIPLARRERDKRKHVVEMVESVIDNGDFV